MSLLQMGTRLLSDYRTNRRRSRMNFDEFTKPHDEPDTNLRQAMEWLRRAHRVTGHQGSPRAYSLVRGWRDVRTDLTGSVAATLLDYGRHTAQPHYVDEAEVMLHWLSEQQHSDGGLGRSTTDPSSTVFETGIAIHAWLLGYRTIGTPRYLQSVRRAADFLAGIRFDERKWHEHCVAKRPHTRQSRVAAALLDAAQLTGNPEHRHAALQVIDWVLAQQLENGYFRNCSLSRDTTSASTHGLAETTRGLLEAYVLHRDPRVLDAIRRTSDAVLDQFRRTENLPAYFDGDLRPMCTYECLTGIAGFAVVWIQLAMMLGETQYRDTGVRATNLLQSLVDRTTSESTRGAVKATHPIWGLRSSFEFPVRTTDSFAYALFLRVVSRQLEGRP